ncbi:MAG: hypothetical protein J5742_02925 [Alphaproteobacteria bacterium]|nr:hypothetical protein [Alphaproteobacteria bacterium]
MSDIPYKIENGKLWVDPERSTFFVLGLKTTENDEHWTENFVLDPHKKTIICFGGDGTKTARAANGYINQFARTFGFTRQQQENMQMLSYYWNVPKSFRLEFYTNATMANREELFNSDYKREVSKVFMPFIAKRTQSGWKKLSDADLLKNMRNIIFTTHCYGTQVMINMLNVLKKQMLSLGYKDKLIETALKQIVSVTNNSQLEMTEDIPTTTLQRYSVADGQSDSDYDFNYSNAYPVHLFKHPEFKKIKGKKSAFIKLKKNDVMMTFDKILTEVSVQYDSTEHNNAFFETNTKKLTKVGKEQMDLIRAIAQYWYNNHDEIPDAVDLLKSVSKGTDLEMFVAASVLNGEALKKEHNNPLRNPHVLTVAKNRFKNRDIEPEHTGIWKLLENSQGRK